MKNRIESFSYPPHSPWWCVRSSQSPCSTSSYNGKLPLITFKGFVRGGCVMSCSGLKKWKASRRLCQMLPEGTRPSHTTVNRVNRSGIFSRSCLKLAEGNLKREKPFVFSVWLATPCLPVWCKILARIWLGIVYGYNICILVDMLALFSYAYALLISLFIFLLFRPSELSNLNTCALVWFLNTRGVNPVKDFRWKYARLCVRRPSFMRIDIFWYLLLRKGHKNLQSLFLGWKKMEG